MTAEGLEVLIRSNEWLTHVLTTVRAARLSDALNGVWRRNPARVSPEQSAARLARHRPGHRWPGVTVIPPG